MSKTRDISNQHASENSFNIILAGHNLDDGIGDFVHLYDFYKYLKEKFKNNSHVNIQCVCCINDEKLNIVNRVYRTNFKIFDEKSVANKLKITNLNNPVGVESENLYFVNESDNHELESALHELNDADKKPDLLFYVSIPLRALEAIQPRSVVFLGEYERGNIYTPVSRDAITDEIWKFSRSMGVAPDRSGIKMIESILKNRKLFENNVDQMVDYQNPYLRSLVNKDAFLAAGYMQSRYQSDIFILNCLALAGNKSTINIVTSFDVANNDRNNLFFGDKLNQFIDSLHFSKIEVVTSSGEVLFEKNGESKDGVRVLRIVQFKNISEHDKNILFARADSVGASGDTSCSEMISSMAFPCIVKKYEFAEQLMNQAESLNLSILKEYLKLLTSMIDIEKSSYIADCVYDKNFTKLENALYEQYEGREIAQFIGENHEVIRSQWRILCAWIIENKNVFEFTDSLIEAAMRHSMGQLKSGDVDAIYLASRSSSEQNRSDTSVTPKIAHQYHLFSTTETDKKGNMKQESEQANPKNRF